MKLQDVGAIRPLLMEFDSNLCLHPYRSRCWATINMDNIVHRERGHGWAWMAAVQGLCCE